MYQLVNSNVPTARLTLGGGSRWVQGGRWAAAYRAKIKRRLRRECMATGAKTPTVPDFRELGGDLHQPRRAVQLEEAT